MFIKNIVIGHSLASIMYAFYNQYHFIANCTFRPFFFDDPEKQSFLGMKGKREIFDEIQNILSFVGANLTEKETKRIRVSDNSLKLFGNDLLASYTFEKCYICDNANITFEHVINHPDIPWDWNSLSQNPSITYNTIISNPYKYWTWYYVSRNPSITFDDVLTYPDKSWNWSYLSLNPNITFDIVEKYSDKPWNWFCLSINPNITFDNVLAHSDKHWGWKSLSENLNVTFENVIEHSDKPWDWGSLSRNPNITFDSVLAHPDKSWDWYNLSQNPNITFDNILAHPDKPWDWIGLSQNTFSKEKQQFIERRYAEYMSAYRIQQCWNRAISIPTNPICIRKIKRDYEKSVERLLS